MGKGDPRTKRGKIFKGTFGKSRPRLKKKRKQLQAQAQESHPQS